MIIDIRQKKLSIGDQYQITLNGEPIYTASREVFQWLAEILVFDVPANRLSIKINKRFHLFKANYEISLDAMVCSFKTVSYLRAHFRCQNTGDNYDIYGHRGRKYSIFKNGRQVGWWEKDRVTWLEGDQYRIIANDDTHIELLIAFCLIIDNYFSSNHGEDIMTINWGYFGLQARHFDQDWRPDS